LTTVSSSVGGGVTAAGADGAAGWEVNRLTGCRTDSHRLAAGIGFGAPT
jgi:hypothetical protein